MESQTPQAQSASIPPYWYQTIQKSLQHNNQMQFCQYFQIALYNSKTNETICDSLKCNKILDKSSISGSENHQQQPKLCTWLDARTDTGDLLKNNKQDTVEVCWFFPLTKEKYRIKCMVSVIDQKSSDVLVIKEIWDSLSEQDLLSLKRPQPGDDMKQSKDELQQYEPQLEDQIPTNFLVVRLSPLVVDILMMAPPQVIADQRRKPQQYESIAQPFKKDRRFLHSFINGEWTTKEINP